MAPVAKGINMLISILFELASQMGSINCFDFRIDMMVPLAMADKNTPMAVMIIKLSASSFGEPDAVSHC